MIITDYYMIITENNLIGPFGGLNTLGMLEGEIQKFPKHCFLKEG